MFMGQLNVCDDNKFAIDWEGREKCEFVSKLIIAPTLIETIFPAAVKDGLAAKSNSHGNFDPSSSDAVKTIRKFFQKNEFILAFLMEKTFGGGDFIMEEVFSDDVREKIASNFSRSKEVKKQLMEKLVDNDMDITEFDKDTLDVLICTLDMVRPYCVDETINYVYNKYNNEDNSIEINHQEGKSIVFEMFLNNIRFNYPQEHGKSIAQRLFKKWNIDAEYIDELFEAAKKVVAVEKEAEEIINE